VTNGSETTPPYTVTVNAWQPAILALRPDLDPYSAYPAALYPDFATYALPESPLYSAVPTRRAQAGDTLIFFGTGFGMVIPDVPTGQVATAAAALAAHVEFWFSRAGPPVAGRIVYAGAAPGTVGLYQFNVVLPEIALLSGETFDDFVAVSVKVDGKDLPTPPSFRLAVSAPSVPF
jgi:uncharacterized protein (TIGR03437 family)